MFSKNLITHTLPGVGGSSRSFFIHHRLWQHCQHLLLRITLGSGFVKRKSESHPSASGGNCNARGCHSDMSSNASMHEDIPVSSRWREDVVEPTKRFERMSWMVLNSALALAQIILLGQSSARVEYTEFMRES
jgi:hypothetical protein